MRKLATDPVPNFRASMRFSTILLAVFFLLTCSPAKAQEVHAAPGEFDYYVLNMSWAPEFCHNVQALPPNERNVGRQTDASLECGTPHGFVLHGLWPQNKNGTWPANCSGRSGPRNYEKYLDITPSLTLLKHEWSKHGTCTTLPPDTFFETARKAFTSVKIPQELHHVDSQQSLRPNDILGLFYRANPSFPQGSILLSCGRNYLTAIEACFDKTSLRPVSCQNLRTCHANTVKIAPEGQESTTP